MFRKVTGSMFELAKHYETYWKNNRCEMQRGFYRECFSQKPIPVRVNIPELKRSFTSEFKTVKNTIIQFLPQDIVTELENIANNSDRFDAEMWAEIVYNYATAFKNVNDESEKYKLLDSLKTLWIGRFVSYAIEAKDMDMNEAEKIIQKQAEVFEDKFDYLRSIY
jgi:hypothetical protein